MILQDTYEVKKADIIPVEVSVPGSKSITNRALLIAALANGKSVLKGVLFSDDSRHFLQALQDLGFVVEIDEPHAVVSIEGKGGSQEDYIERVAREKLGYVMPDEKVYYDITPGN